MPVEATQIPLPELFFAGGSNSLRSFSINQAGPRDPQTGYPIGGQGLFVNNLEIRTPPVLLPYVGNNLGFVFFHDMGNVFDTANHIMSGMVRLSISRRLPSAPRPAVRCPVTSAITRKPWAWEFAIRLRSVRCALTWATPSIRRAIRFRNQRN